ncbi:MAG TPA: Ig-like domain-containing protein [Pyrinomonadaceae bacterium]|nr:Ig-like domain-containing protein [Pyrinomonadaceae bacterium]
MPTQRFRSHAFVILSALLVALASAASGLAPFSSNSKVQGASARTLSFDERVAYQRALDEVYWRHTVWPKENSAPKPSFDEVVTREQTAAKVEDTLRKSEALALRWGRPVLPEQLQAEVARMARETRSPEVLRELLDALGNDAFVVAEVLARPALVDRLARTSFLSEEQPGSKSSFNSWWAGAGADFISEAAPASDFSYQLAEINQAGADDTWRPTQSLPPGNGTAVWTGSEVIIWGGATSLGGRTNLGSRYNPATDTWAATSNTNVPLARTGHTAVWTGTEMIVFGGSIGSGSTNTGGRYNPSTDTWTPTSTAGAPFRSGHLAVWTGSKMIVWGTSAGAAHVYDPSADTWKAATLANAPGADVGHRAVWTGTEMFIWGGLNTVTGKRGGLYNPATDTWRSPSHFNAPSARTGFTMVWTGTEAIVWGGYEGNTVTLNTGGRYNPSTDTWTPTSTANAADSRYGHTAVWTGTEMVVYGGDSRPTGSPDKLVNTGGRYNPSTDSWTLTPTAGAPLKNNHTAVWTGSEMFVWGGRHVSLTIFTEAARYRPSTDSWIPTNNAAAAPDASDARGVWSGTELLVWGRDSNCGGACSVGGRYDLATDSWRPMSMTGAPSSDAAAGSTAIWTGTEMLVAGKRYNPLADAWTSMSTVGSPLGSAYTAVWTGTQMVVWGGVSNPDGTMTAAGGRYDPSSDKWKPMSMMGAPDARQMHSAVWTGSEMVVWGGMQFFSGSNLNTGGRYNPSTDSWRPVTTAGAPEARLYNSAVWTGSEMVVWGGYVYNTDGTSYYLNTGGRYNPVSDSWQPTSLAGAPAARSRHRAVWTGSQVVVWGGRVPVTGTGTLNSVNTGGRYNPASDVWTATSLQGAPSGRDSHVQVWTGTQMIVWGGTGPAGAPTNDGAVYNAPGGSAGNAAPSVRLTSPTENAPFVAGDNIQLAAEASDTDGAVTSVSFYANDTLLGTDSAAPFTFTWNKVRSGSYALTAAAADDAGGITRSAAVNINVEALIGPPNAVITSPADLSTFVAPATIHVAADVTPNPDYDVTKVEFWLGDGKGGTQTLVHTDTTAPYGFDLTNQPEGSYSIYAYAHDGQDVGISPGARFTVTAGQTRPFNISGQVADGRGIAIPNITVQLTGSDTVTTKTNASGYYFFGSLLKDGSYTVTPSAANYSYSPPSRTFDKLIATQSDANFVATQAGYGISGYVRDAGGNPIYPATVNLSGSKTATTSVDVTGYYFFGNLAPGGTYTVQPYKNQFNFEPGFRTYANLNAEQAANFVGTPQGTSYTVSGRVIDPAGVPLAGLRMRLETLQGDVKFRTADAQGRFLFDNLLPGQTCKVWPEDATYTYNFSPTSRDYYSLAASQADADFVATPHTVSGKVTQSGSGLSGVTVTLDGPQTATVTTGADGGFAIRGVNLRGDYTVTATKAGYSLTPTQYAVKDLQEDVTANFAGASLATPTPTTSTAGLQYYPLPKPVRLLDTRPGEPACFTPGKQLGANTSRTQVATGTCGGVVIPSTAKAVVGNAAVVNTHTGATAGHLTLYPSGVPKPVAANVNYVPGDIVSNAFTVGLGADGAFNVYAYSTLHVVVDVTGYYAPPGAGGLYYHPLPKPVRLLDTRIGQTACDAPGSPIKGGTSRAESARTTCSGVVLPDDAQAIVGNVAVVNMMKGATAGYLTVYPTGVERPVGANVNYAAGQIASNAFTVRLGADGAFNIFALTTLDVVVDVTGYYSASPAADANGAAGLLYYPLASPMRLLDTRPGEPACTNPATPLAAGGVRTQNARLTCGGLTVPTSALAVVGNAAVVNTLTGSVAGHLTLYPGGVSRPTAANVNYAAGQVVSNSYTTGLGADGAFQIYATSATHFVADVSGYFAP